MQYLQELLIRKEKPVISMITGFSHLWQMTLILIKDAPPLERIAPPMAHLHPRALKLTVLT